MTSIKILILALPKLYNVQYAVHAVEPFPPDKSEWTTGVYDEDKQSQTFQHEICLKGISLAGSVARRPKGTRFFCTVICLKATMGHYEIWPLRPMKPAGELQYFPFF